LLCLFGHETFPGLSRNGPQDYEQQNISYHQRNPIALLSNYLPFAIHQHFFTLRWRESLLLPVIQQLLGKIEVGFLRHPGLRSLPCNSTIAWQNRSRVLEASRTEELPLLATSLKMETTTSLHAQENANAQENAD